MAQLRRKLEPDPARPRWLITEPGMGYRYQPPDQGTEDADLPFVHLIFASRMLSVPLETPKLA
jgi:hypothetical protein